MDSKRPEEKKRKRGRPPNSLKITKNTTIGSVPLPATPTGNIQSPSLQIFTEQLQNILRDQNEHTNTAEHHEQDAEVTESYDHESAKELGLKLLKYRGSRQKLDVTQDTVCKGAILVSELQERISLEEADLQNMRLQIEVLQERVNDKQDGIDGTRVELNNEMMVVRSAKFQEELLMRQIFEMRTELGL